MSDITAQSNYKFVYFSHIFSTKLNYNLVSGQKRINTYMHKMSPFMSSIDQNANQVNLRLKQFSLVILEIHVNIPP